MTARDKPELGVQTTPRGVDAAMAFASGGAFAGTAAAMEDHSAWPMASRLPVLLSVSIPLNRLRVRDLLNLTPGQTIRSSWPLTEDVPLRVGQVQLAWGEFEVVDRRMALRLARLA